MLVFYANKIIKKYLNRKRQGSTFYDIKFIIYPIFLFRLLSNHTKEDVAVMLAKTLQCNFNDLPDVFFLDDFRYNRPYNGSGAYKICISDETTQSKFINCSDLIRNECAEYFVNNITCLEKIKETRACAAEPDCFNKMMMTKPGDPFVKRQSCLGEIHRTKILPCVTLLKRQCEAAEIVVAKTIRLTMQHVEIMMKYDPLLKVIHLVRDPRSIIASRIQIKSKLGSEVFSSIDLLCQDMLSDIDKAASLHQLYPGRILELPYELAAKERILVIRQLYNYLDKTIELQPTRPISDKKMEKPYSTFRNNSQEIAYKWKSQFTNAELTTIASIPSCITLVKLMGYDFS